MTDRARGLFDAQQTSVRHVAVVIPCFKSQLTVGEVVDRTIAALAATGIESHLVLVDDASPDETWNALLAAKRRHPAAVSCYRLARNVGQHSAIVCGLAHIDPRVDMIVTIDDDLQQRPEDIVDMIAALRPGVDMVIGAYQRKWHAGWRNLGGRLVDGVLRRLFDIDRSLQFTSFRAFRRFVAEEVVDQRASFVYLTAALLSASNRVDNVPVSHSARASGASGYTLGRSITLAANLILNYSRLPFVIVIAIFALSFGFTALMVAYVMLARLLYDDIVPGWASVTIMMGVQSTMLMSAIAMVLLYVARSHRMLNGIGTRYRIADVA